MPKTSIPVLPEHLIYCGRVLPAWQALEAAINDCLKSEFYAAVGSKDFYIYTSVGKRIFASRQERALSNFIEEYDNGRSKPAEIVLDIPTEFLR